MVGGLPDGLRRGAGAILRISKRMSSVRPPALVSRQQVDRLGRAVQEALAGRARDWLDSEEALTARVAEEVRRAMRRQPPLADAGRPIEGGGRRTGIVADGEKSDRRRRGERRRRWVPIDFADRRQQARRGEDQAELSEGR